jgi:phenylacetic acid degradation operon negative regulatory protein
LTCPVLSTSVILVFVNAKTEEFLNLFLWTAEQLTRPTFRNLTDSYESWAYRIGDLSKLHRLERQRWIERKTGGSNDRIYRLTAQGRLHVLGGRDPEQRWTRHWDGQWRMVLFDVPLRKSADRVRLWRYLRGRGFGYLQKSVWITPDPLTEEHRILTGGKIDVESLILLRARPCAGESDEQIVAGAWDFEEINIRYAQYLKVLNLRPGAPLRRQEAAKVLQQWMATERVAWLSAVSKDPLLPEQILPAGYLGQRAWHRRKKELLSAGNALRTFRPE